MRRVPMAKRPDARQRLEAGGCFFADMYGEPYMWESMPQAYAYEFAAEEVERLQEATRALHDVALAVVDYAATHESALASLGVPDNLAQAAMASWRRQDVALYQRMDLGLDPTDGQFKLLEYNGDTPTGVVEMNCYLDWLYDAIELDMLPPGADQFNEFRMELTEHFGNLAAGAPLYFAAARGLTEEENTVEFLRLCADDAGHDARFIFLDEIGVDAQHNFADQDQFVIENLFKLLPWEDIAIGPYAQAAQRTTTCRFFEPMWKMVWSNKAFLVLAWELFEGHEHLLPAFFEDDPRASTLKHYIRKPQWGREGQNMSIVRDGTVGESLGGEYADDRMIVQALIDLPSFDGRYPVFGSWVIAGKPAGILIREDAHPITSNLSNCLPHYVLP
ncbi:MAG: glutathionylspermidine synthase family protein [Gammaproteobacteria bacterium]|nr:glutathionylspermidine synthase family protein [Gammaproteobacteria bacterium]